MSKVMLNMAKFISLFGILILGLVLTSINIYGEFQEIRPEYFFNDELRFKNDQPTSFHKTLSQLTDLPDENKKNFAAKATQIIAKGIAHIHWERNQDDKFNQLVPIWENYFLYFMGKYSGIPEFEKYHFANYKRSLKRGIGVCGDTSMILSQVLTKHNINNNIVTFPGHVVVEAKFDDGIGYVLDADFGVVIPIAVDEIKKNSDMVANLYLDAGYTVTDANFIRKMSQEVFQRWNGTEHFITKKYYFEKVAYWLKWPLPMVMVFLVLFIKYRRLRC